jgi:hypothetical protein
MNNYLVKGYRSDDLPVAGSFEIVRSVDRLLSPGAGALVEGRHWDNTRVRAVP